MMQLLGDVLFSGERVAHRHILQRVVKFQLFYFSIFSKNSFARTISPMPTTNPMQFPGPMVSHLGVHKGRSTGIGYPLQTLTGACGPDNQARPAWLLNGPSNIFSAGIYWSGGRCRGKEGDSTRDIPSLDKVSWFGARFGAGFVLTSQHIS